MFAVIAALTPVALAVAEDEPIPAAAARPVANEEVYRGYLGMSADAIDAIPAYQMAYGINDDDCLSIAIIAHAAARPFGRAVEDFAGPCHRSLSELMRLYSVPRQILYVDLERSEPCPVVYQRLYEPYWDGRYDNVVSSNTDCGLLFGLRVSTEFWRCPPPVFFDRCGVYGSPLACVHRERVWWPEERRARGFPVAPPVVLPSGRAIPVAQPPREHRFAPTDARRDGRIGGSSAGFVPPGAATAPQTSPPASASPTPTPRVEQRPRSGTTPTSQPSERRVTAPAPAHPPSQTQQPSVRRVAPTPTAPVHSAPPKAPPAASPSPPSWTSTPSRSAPPSSPRPSVAPMPTAPRAPTTSPAPSRSPSVSSAPSTNGGATESSGAAGGEHGRLNRPDQR